jgi:uncharacterized membrane protein YgaE (UPF0421/DUF939 family)
VVMACQHQRMASSQKERARELSARGGELFEEAAVRSRVSMRARVERLVLATRSILQLALATTAAWLVSTEVLGHRQAIFAPISAIVVLGLTVGQRFRRAAELALGVAVGIGIADLVVAVIGVGAWQLSLIVLLATVIAVLLGSGQLFATQVAVSAVLVATLEQGSGVSVDRFLDALVGGGVALAISALLLPPEPLALLRRAAAPVLAELAGTLDDVAEALGRRDVELAERALLRGREIDALEARFQEAADVGRETARMAPPRRRLRGRVDAYAVAAAQVDLAVRNARVLARGAIRAIQLDENVPPEISEALHDLAAAVRALEAVLEDEGRAADVREPAVRAAATATMVLERTGNLSVSVIVGQIRSTAADLLRGTGLSYEEASAVIRAAAREAQERAREDP